MKLFYNIRSKSYPITVDSFLNETRDPEGYDEGTSRPFKWDSVVKKEVVDLGMWGMNSVM